MNRNEYIASIMLEAAELLKNDISLNEDIETLLTYPNKYFSKNITLYHGSPIGNLNKIKASSINVGTRLSKSRKSSFWSDDYSTAVSFAITHLLHLIKCDDIYRLGYNHKGEVKLIVLKENIQKIINILRNHKIYMYETKINPKTIGVGHAREVREFTIDYDVSVDNVNEIPFKISMNSIIPVNSYESIKAMYIMKEKHNIVKKLVYHHNWVIRKKYEVMKKFTNTRSIQDMILDYPVDLFITDIYYKGARLIINDSEELHSQLNSSNSNLKDMIFDSLSDLDSDSYILDTVIVHMISDEKIIVLALCYNAMINDVKVYTSEFVKKIK